MSEANDAFRGPKVLVIASVPPPVAGQPLATRMLLDTLLAQGITFDVVDLARPFYSGRFCGRVRRAFRVAALGPIALWKLLRLGVRGTVVYLQLGHGARSLYRDLALLALVRLPGPSLVLHLHGGGFRSAFESSPRWLRSTIARQIRNATRVIVLTRSLTAQFAGLVDATRVVVVDNGVPKEVEARARLGRRPSRTSNSGAFRVLFLSNLIAAKGYLTVLEAARRASERGRDFQFVLAGSITEETPTRPEDFVRIAGIGNTRYVGPVEGEAKLQLFEEADLLVLPSRMEGQPIVLLEAMHFGLPIITCRVGGIPDFVLEGENGLLVPPEDPDALLEAIERIATDAELRERMGRRNRADAANRYTATAHGEAVLEVIRDALASNLAGR